MTVFRYLRKLSFGILLLIAFICIKNDLLAQEITSDLNIFSRTPFKTFPDNDAPVTYKNPVIPGAYSDPSICKVGEDYYLVTSSFEYFPGVPVFHSKDLINWEQIGHCIDRKEQLPEGLNILAATIRYHNGTFYMITTNLVTWKNWGNFYVTAKNPAGPWSDPIRIGVKGIDPDLFFDDNGKVYVITAPFILYEINIETGEILGQGKTIWYGTGGRAAEGPRIYKKDGFYYLMAAEGGTEEAHSVTIARATNIWGPYINHKDNPILTHCNQAGSGLEIQGVGHADMIQAHNGSWWMVLHGYRSVERNPHHILGRETCLVPVVWPKNGWPVVNGNGTVPINMTCETLPLKPFPEKPTRIEFNDGKLGFEWNYIQLPDYNNYSLEERKGYLRLKGSAATIRQNTSLLEVNKSSPTFVGRRLQDLYFTATTSMLFNPKNENEEAGIALVNNGSCFRIVVEKSGNKRYVVVKLDFDGITYQSDKKVLNNTGPVILRIKGDKTSFSFSYSQEGDKFKNIETIHSKYLSTETAGGYTGVYVGLYSTGNGKDCKAFADYDWFEYIKD